MDKVITRRVPNDSSKLNDELHPILNLIYRNRGIADHRELERELSDLLPFDTLSHIDKAVERLYQALIKQEKILIIGDFDTDGATSTAVAIRSLRAFGATHIDFMVPNRFHDGYGLTSTIVEQAKQRQPDLIITVDNGISSHEGVACANQYGIDVVITDHHLPPDTLPNAFAIVNPNCVGDAFPSKCIAGVGVIFYVMLALRRELVETNWFKDAGIKAPNMAQMLDLVALGTVADVVSLDKNNRIMVHQGLRRIKHGKCCPGIIALLEVGKRNPAKIVASDLGFAVAPRLNAAGRLEDMRLGIECLLAPDLAQARQMAHRLDELNQERRTIEAEMQTQAYQVIKDIQLDSQLPKGICLYQAEWHQGVIGIIAGRVKDRFHRPVVAFAKVSDNELKGSARSIKGIHIRDVLELIALKNPDLIQKFGGHAMAAGLSIHPDNYMEFNQAFSQQVNELVDDSMLNGEILSDGELNDSNLTLDLAELIRTEGPWGQNFPEPLFDGVFDLIEQRIVGAKHLKMTLALPGLSKTYDAIAFNIDVEKWPNYRCEQVHIAYRIDVNEFNNRRVLQLIVESIQES